MSDSDAPVEVTPPRAAAAARRGFALAVAVVAALVLIGAVVLRGGGNDHRKVRIDLRAVASASYEPVRIHIVGNNGEGERWTADGVIDPRGPTVDIADNATVHGHYVHWSFKVVDGTSYMDPHSTLETGPDAAINQPTEAQLDAFLHGRHWVGTKVRRSRHTSSTTSDTQLRTALTVQLLTGIGGDPRAPLAQLALAGIKVVDVGPGTVDGIALERYRLRYSQHDLFPHSDSEPRQPITTLELWVDHSNHERQAEMSTPAYHSESESSPAFYARTTFSDYGIAVHVKAPNPRDVVPSDDYFRWLNGFINGQTTTGILRRATATTVTVGR